MNSPGLSGADQASGEPAQTEVNIGMKPHYYNGAAKGEIKVFKDIPEPLNQLLTPNRNTVLHIHLASPVKRSEDSESKDSKSKDSKPENSKLSTGFVEEILTECPLLLWQANVKGETPLHIAARYGHDAVVAVLIKRAKSPQQDLESGVNKTVKEMLEMTNNEKDTALHEAVCNNHLDVVERLIQEGPDFSYSRNETGETPLYIAVERNYNKVALHILHTCKSPAHDGPLGRTTLHAAVFWSNTEMTQKILEGKTQQDKSALIKQVDKQRWTPLHCAAYFGHSESAKVLLEVDRSMAYMKDAKGMTALHIAAHRGHRWVVEEILKFCPDCCELVDERGWNALHFVVNSSSSYWAGSSGLEYILNISPSLGNLLNEKDARGNTPFHHHSKSLHFLKEVMCHDRVDKMAFNKQNLNAYDVAITSEELSDEKLTQIRDVFYDFENPLRAEFRRPLEDDILRKRKDRWQAREAERKAKWKARKDRFVSIMKEASQYHLVVDTLIATVAFTAAITMPGGFIGQEGPHSHSGSPVLMRNTAFKAFIITNTIALLQSCSAAFIHLFTPLFLDEQNIGDFSFVLASLAFCLSISAMGAMVLAFVLGTYAVLMHSLGLAIANSVIGLCFFIPLFFVSIGCSRYLLDILRMGSSWISDRLEDFLDFLLSILCIPCAYIFNGCEALCACIVYIFNCCRRN